MDRFLRRAIRLVGLRASLNVLVTSSRELKLLNRHFRGQDEATDVLSFPSVSSRKEDFAGDIAISADIATQNSKDLGHSAAEELKILVLHGVLHLAGYDHERDHGAMARKEARLRKALGLRVSLIERSRVREGRGEGIPKRTDRRERPSRTPRKAARPTVPATGTR